MRLLTWANYRESSSSLIGQVHLLPVFQIRIQSEKVTNAHGSADSLVSKRNLVTLTRSEVLCFTLPPEDSLILMPNQFNLNQFDICEHLGQCKLCLMGLSLLHPLPIGVHPCMPPYFANLVMSLVSSSPFSHKPRSVNMSSQYVSDFSCVSGSPSPSLSPTSL